MAYLSVNNLSLTLDSTPLLHSISFEVERGEITLIAGKNGSGKSLLLKCIKGLEKPSSGKIFLAGKELKKSKERMLKIGLVFQDPALEIVGSTVEKDIAFGLENLGIERAEIERLTVENLKRFNLYEKRGLSPSVLSGGEKRKLCIASLLAMGNEILLLDEPFANLDYPSTLIVINTLLELKREGITTVIVSHEAEKFLAHTDNTIILKDGSIVAKGKSNAMLSALRENEIFIPHDATFERLTWLE